MKLATFLPFLRRDYVYGMADHSGSLVAHQDILLWSLRMQVVEGAVLFLEHLPFGPVAGQHVKGLARAALAELPADLASRVEAVTIQWFGERRAVTEDVVFVTKLPEFSHLATVIDVRQLVGALHFLVEHPEERQSLGRAARRRIKDEFTWSAVVRRFGSVWADQVAAGQNGRLRARNKYVDYAKVFSHYGNVTLERGRVFVSCPIQMLREAEGQLHPGDPKLGLLRLCSTEPQELAELIKHAPRAARASMLSLLKKGMLECWDNASSAVSQSERWPAGED